MNIINNVRDNWTEIITRLIQDKQELAQFLRFSAGMYKQSFSDAALIYHQNPNATKVATLETWNKLGRLVNKGEHSIAVFGEDSKAKHLFDITQTNGKRIPELWKLTEDLSSELTAVINKKYGRGCKDINETIAAISVDNIRPHLSEMMYATGQMKLTDNDLKVYQQSVVSAVRFVVSQRAFGSNNGGINLKAAEFFKDNRDLIRFCDLVQKSAKDTLLEMEREIVQILRQRREKNELQTKSDRTNADRNSVHGKSRRTENAPKAHRQVGQNVAGLGESRVPHGGADIRDGGSVADNSENNRQRGGEPLSRTGRAVPSGKSPSAGVLGNSVVGENASADGGTRDNGGNNFSVEELIERYKNADFNRRLDSFEVAGYMLYEANYNEFRGGAVAFFECFEAEKYSEAQANEIRKIISAAIENREKSHDFIDLSVPYEQPQNEPVILNNEIVETTELPPFINEEYITEILKHDKFFKIKRDKIAEFFEDNQDVDKRAEFMKKVFNSDYTELDYGDTRLGYKADKSGVLMWEGNFLSRTSESVFSWDLVQSLVADLIEKEKYIDKKAVPQMYAEELDEGDKIRIDGEVWTVKHTDSYQISFVNDNGERKAIYNSINSKWYDILNEQGFEIISENDLSEPVFAEPTKQEFPDPEPVSQVEQLSFFGSDTEPVVPPKNIPKRPIAVSATLPDDEMVDYILKCGSNEPKSLERIAAQFQKEKTAAENAEFLRKEFGEDGRGYKFAPRDNTRSALLAAWFDSSGITAAISNTAFPQGEKIHISWEQAAEKITALLDKGEYCSQDIIDRAAELEMTDIAGELWYIHQDLSSDYRGKYFVPEEFFKGGFPDSTERIKISLLDENTLQKYIEGMENLIGEYEKDKNIMRYHFHKLRDTLGQLKDLRLPRKEFITNADFKFEPKFFITEDEKDRLLTTGSGVEGGKFRIEKFFKGEHTAKEKANFLKNEYGTGGTGRSGFNTWHDSKGLKYTKDALSSNDCEIFMKWSEIASRIDVLIAEDRYITQSDIDERIRSAKYTVKNHKIETDYDKAVVDAAKKILAEYGVEIEEKSDISETKSPLEKVIEKAENAGIPVEIISEEKAVFMDVRDETFIAVEQVDEGISYSVYTSDLTLVDGGVWEMDEGMDLKSAAADLLATMEKNIADVPSYDNFMELASGNSDKNISEELAKIKSDIYAKISSENISSEKSEKNISENNKNNSDISAVNSPEKITVPDIKPPKSGVPVTYHFSPENIAAGGAKSRFNSNIEAIKTLRKIEAENRFATAEEQAVMAKYVGWGGIQQAFVSDKVAENISGNLGEAAPSGWENEQKELLELLSPEEYKAARASTLTSFYTPPDVADGIYQALSQFGFEGGNVLEPSMGVGNFFAKMPDDMRDNSKLYGVELDSISGRIAQQLYPNERIQIKGFEHTNFNNNSFDVVIGNIPFGDYRVSDKKYDKYNFKIHDYFAAKAVDKVKPNGVVALVTSKFTMDKLNEKARRYLAERCDLLGAVRLPAGTFKDADSVTTDILFLKKRETMTVEIPDWVHMSQTEDGIPCNKYFVDNPEMVLGKMAWDERMKGKFGDDSKVTTCYANKDIPLSEQLKNAVSKIEGKIETVKEKVSENSDINIIPADPSVRNFTHTLVDGKLFFRENEIMTEVAETGKTLDRMMGLHKIRQAAMAVIDAQAADCSDEELLKLQAELNSVYDKFKKSYGNITDVMNERCFRHDDDFNTLAALEVIDTEKKTVEKSEIFFKRTIQPELEITSVDTQQEALQVSIDRVGRVDIEYMAGLAGISPEQLIADLGSEIFRNPAKIKEGQPYSGYEDASEYLSGNVREKLKIAKDYAKHIDGNFEKNAAALEKVIPKNLEAGEISVRIGANWIDVEDYNNFLTEYAKADMVLHPVMRTRMGEYKIDGKNRDYSVAASGTYGTSRMNSYCIFENLLNQRDIVVRDRCEEDGKVWYEVNAKETQLAKEKARQMKAGFKDWIWQDIDRREKYVEKYNNLFNAIRGREYDGSHQTFPGMNPAIKLRPHQENAILRGKLGGNTLLAHCVGAGKSFEIVATTMEKKRLGLISKGCVVVPKHLTLQMASEWIRLYPNARLLVAHPEDFSKDNRQKFIARCVTGDYDAVIMSFTQFEKIPMSDEYRKQFLEKELDEIMDALNEVDDTDRVSVKTLERQKRKIEERLEKLTSSKKDNSLCFEKLGFDYLAVDEFHNYKNCFIATKMSNVAGVQTTAAQKSEDMLMKTQYLNEKYGCNNILTATGTPLSNSMTELYTMQRYLRPDLLENAGLENFDDWASTFGEVVSQLEMKPAGDGYRMKNRFSKFVNIPELMQMYKEFADIQTADMLKLPVPKLKTGEPIVVSAKPNDLQKAYMQELARRSEAIHNGKIDPSEDNMLRITHEARLLGLDSRCIFRNSEPSPDSKVAKLLDNLEKNYHETADKKGVQIVFCDIAIDEDAEHFSVYEAIKEDLIKRGIPREEICFAGDAKTDKARAEMFEQLRKGEKRFILASTSKLGTGANVQDKICAIHHLDIPWKPSDIAQQDGRGIRQGNTFNEVGIYHYLTEETFDAYLMGIITNKAKFINQIMTSKDPVRVAEDVDETVLTYSQMQAVASGNPLIMEKIQLDNDIANLKTLEAEHKKSTFAMQELAERKLPSLIENYADLLQQASGDLKKFQEQRPENADFKIELNGKVFDERTEAGAEIEKAIIKCSATGDSIKVGKYFGFDVTVEKNRNTFNLGTPCIAALNGNLKYTCEVSLKNELGNIRRIENLASSQINQKIQQLSASLDKAKNDLAEAKANAVKPFERAAELEKMQKRLEVVNAGLSDKKIDISDDDEPIHVSDIPPEAVSVTVAMPTMAMADSPNLKPKPENISEQRQNIFRKNKSR